MVADWLHHWAADELASWVVCRVYCSREHVLADNQSEARSSLDTWASTTRIIIRCWPLMVCERYARQLEQNRNRIETRYITVTSHR